MRALFGLFSLILVGCDSSEDKDDVDTGVTSPAADEGAEDDDWWEEDDDDGGSGDWEKVPGFSVIFPDEESGDDIWFFVEELEGDASKDEPDPGDDSEDETDPEDESDSEDDMGESWVGPACVMKWESWEPICIAFSGADWGSSDALDPEAYCEAIADDSEEYWYYTEDGCGEEPKARCGLDEDTPEMVEGYYYSPMPLEDAEESCEEEDGTFYPLVDEDDEEDWGEDDWDEEEYDLGTRWVGYIAMSNEWGFASFEHFTESGENCKANTMVYSITDAEPCENCEFSKSFVLGEFEYEIDEGGCPTEELDELVGVTGTFGHGNSIIFEDEGAEFRTLWFLDDE